jgi:large subunit ribosomal protein L18
MFNKAKRRKKIRLGIRRKIRGSADSPRLSVFRSNKGIYCQLIDDASGSTLVSASSDGLKGSKIEQAQAVGKDLAAKAKGKNIENVVFDRGGYLYHGRIKALADSAREGGLQF